MSYQFICNSCGRQCNPNSKFCVGCGNTLNFKTIVCDKCNAVLISTSKFCKKCGNKIPQKVEETIEKEVEDDIDREQLLNELLVIESQP